MANICNTQLKVYGEKLDIEAMNKWLNENYCYDDTMAMEGEEDYCEGYCSTKWNVQTETLKEFAKLFQVNVTAIGQEDGIGFIQVVKVNEIGDITQDEEIGY